MNTYEYVAAGADGALVSGRAAAVDEVALDRDLATRGLTLTRANVAVSAVRRRRLKLHRSDLLTLTTQLSTMAAAGVNVVGGLEGIGRRLERPQSKLLVEELVQTLRSGAMLSEAMDRYPASFPPVYRASVRAGEASGALDRVLDRLAKYLEWVRGMRATTVQALIYPCILFVAILGLILVLLYFVLPKIVALLPGGRESLPTETKIVLGASDFVTAYWPALLLGGAAVIACTVLVRRTARGRERIDAFLLRVPKFGTLQRQLAVSRFASTASILQEAGCDVFTVLEVSGATCGNAALSGAVKRVGESVRRGSTITHAMEEEPLIDPLLVQMVSVGEATGALDTCLKRLVAYYDEEIPRAVKRFLAVLEPAMLLGAGVVVAFILLAALLPIFSLYESFG